MQPKVAAKVSRLLKLCSSVTRIRLLAAIDKKAGMAVEEIAHKVGMTHSAVSHQLAILKGAGVVSRKKNGRKASYSLTDSKAAKVAMAAIEYAQ